ncbi:hypothetical protein BU23DRAFT_12683 [Bimuria novae-zelandiae CBS 107.79]|uniref:Uncharacterized protein n=1 Tax=Bimuria novae-zelandiae CBS 107.79 TaxID=1447943 RepID=A0A6A5VJI4_9PLEO|nr:hypothetical protein BU23DRAFT_12683 [Bimuria novae-zelandiae CBS 107.79]
MRRASTLAFWQNTKRGSPQLVLKSIRTRSRPPPPFRPVPALHASLTIRPHPVLNLTLRTRPLPVLNPLLPQLVRTVGRLYCTRGTISPRAKRRAILTGRPWRRLSSTMVARSRVRSNANGTEIASAYYTTRAGMILRAMTMLQWFRNTFQTVPMICKHYGIDMMGTTSEQVRS